MTILAETKHKFRSAEEYFRWIEDHGWLTPGEEVQREDGKTYIVCGDGVSLKTPEGVYVCALRLDPYIHQGFFSVACNVEETLEDVDPDRTLFPEIWENEGEWVKMFKGKFPFSKNK